MFVRNSFVAVVLGAISVLSAYASGDFSCGAPRGNLTHRTYDACNSVPFLSPANDTRLNMQLLLIDSGKLVGQKRVTQDGYRLKDEAWLTVPFDFTEWQVRVPGAKPDKEATPNDADTGSDTYAQGEGSRCRTADDGLADFKEAIKVASSVPAAEASLLIDSRTSMPADCSENGASSWKPPVGIHSSLGQQFATYIAGANAFYKGDFPEALKSFSALSKSPNPWLRETSRYMVGRVQLNSAQKNAFGEWGSLQLDKVDKPAMQAAEAAFDSYLHDFPKGIYANSARGLLRRVYWLENDQTKLAAAYDQAFLDAAKGSLNVTVPDLVEEADAKLLSTVDAEVVRSPQMLAIIDLMKMRGTEKGASSFSLAELEGQKDRFASNRALYEYLLAVHYLYVDIQPEKTLALLPNPPNGQLNYFAFSQQTLRGLALEVLHRFDDARGLFVKLLPISKQPLQQEQLQLAIARIDELTGHVDRVFAQGSPVTAPTIRTILLEQSASADLLRQEVKDQKENAGVREAALYTLLFKELTGAKYSAFQQDIALVPDHPSEFLAPFVSKTKAGEYSCPVLKDVAATLEKNPDDAKSLICIGELVRIHGVHYEQQLGPGTTDLGGGPSQFPGVAYSRLDAYTKVIANQHAEADARAYALFRAVHCFEPSGNNDCGTQDVPKNTRRQWFHSLKTDYPSSEWAQSLKYYW